MRLGNTFRPWITDKDKAAVAEVVDSGDLMSGKLVRLFEDALASYFGKRHAVCVSSGTAALECAIAATGHPPVAHPHNFIAVRSAMMSVHGRMSVNENGLRSDLLGVSVLSWMGVHDAAHNFTPRGARPFGVTCFSFNANKFIACVGGVAVTNDSHHANVMRQYRNHGRDGALVVGVGSNYRMGEINAALGMSQLRRIDEIMSRRKQVAAWYDEITGQNLVDTRESWFLYPVPQSARLAAKHRSLADFRLSNSATQEERDTALLPIWPLMTKDDCEAVC